MATYRFLSWNIQRFGDHKRHAHFYALLAHVLRENDVHVVGFMEVMGGQGDTIGNALCAQLRNGAVQTAQDEHGRSAKRSRAGKQEWRSQFSQSVDSDVEAGPPVAPDADDDEEPPAPAAWFTHTSDQQATNPGEQYLLLVRPNSGLSLGDDRHLAGVPSEAELIREAGIDAGDREQLENALNRAGYLERFGGYLPRVPVDHAELRPGLQRPQGFTQAVAALVPDAGAQDRLWALLLHRREPGFPFPQSRPPLIATIEGWPGGPLSFVLFHAPGPRNDDDADGTAGPFKAVQALRHLEALARGPRILMGDFNLSETQIERNYRQYDIEGNGTGGNATPFNGLTGHGLRRQCAEASSLRALAHQQGRRHLVREEQELQGRFRSSPYDTCFTGLPDDCGVAATVLDLIEQISGNAALRSVACRWFATWAKDQLDDAHTVTAPIVQLLEHILGIVAVRVQRGGRGGTDYRASVQQFRERPEVSLEAADAPVRIDRAVAGSRYRAFLLYRACISDHLPLLLTVTTP